MRCDAIILRLLLWRSLSPLSYSSSLHVLPGQMLFGSKEIVQIVKSDGSSCQNTLEEQPESVERAARVFSLADIQDK
jgi:hypothetical protein